MALTNAIPRASKWRMSAMQVALRTPPIQSGCDRLRAFPLANYLSADSVDIHENEVQTPAAASPAT